MIRITRERHELICDEFSTIAVKLGMKPTKANTMKVSYAHDQALAKVRAFLLHDPEARRCIGSLIRKDVANAG